MEASITEHENLLEAIERGDASRAEQLNRERIQHIRDAFARSMAFTFV
jgi:DNA-binding GntR family transcriptional regulator